MQDFAHDANVFVIDDDQFQLDLFATQLSRHGLPDTRGFRTGEEALTHLAGDSFDYPLIFLDLNMPGMDGVEFLRKLVEIKYGGALALVSGEDARTLDSVAKLASAHHLEVVGYLHKPVNNDALETTLERWRTHISTQARKPLKLYDKEEIQRALTLRETVNYYQPKVHLSNGAFYGVETLVRWQHPQDGMVFPDQFVGRAEEYGLIEELTLIVLMEALEQQQQWKDQGIPCSVAVNVSMDNLVRLEFPNIVQTQLSHFGVPPESLILEVTESRLTHDMTVHLDILTRLRLKHVALSIDDFGTGHSSLAQLRDLPFTELKIDRSFIHTAFNNTFQRAIVEANLAMAAQLGMTVVAEGIEDKEDWRFVRERGCDRGQGYFIAKPMPASDLPNWLEDWESRRAELLTP